jgi:hypothetical protein
MIHPFVSGTGRGCLRFPLETVRRRSPAPARAQGGGELNAETALS